MAAKSFSNQTGKQLLSHLEKFLDSERFDIKIDTFAGVAEVRKSLPRKKGPSKKKKRLRKEMQDMRPRKRKKVLSAKRREKPKLKHVRNGRMISLKGYTGFE